jgi:hypothetical protein
LNSESLAAARQNKNLAAAVVVQLGGSVLIWHMIKWVSTACCLYAARSTTTKMKTAPTGIQRRFGGGFAPPPLLLETADRVVVVGHAASPHAATQLAALTPS